MRWWPLVLLIGACATHDRDRGQVVQGLTQCPDQLVDGVDVYNGNGAIDWQKVKAAGKDFAFIKATQGDYNKQTTFAANWSGAKAAGVIRSPYHFFDGTIDGVVQAQAFLDQVSLGGGLGVGDLPAMLDIECPTSSSQGAAQSNCEYTGNSGWVPTATLNQRIFDWLDTVSAATGHPPIIYSYPSWFAAVSVTDPRLAQYPLFIASYNSCATIPAPWTTAVFWQYSATGAVNGITGGVDLDHFFGTADQLATITIQPPQADAGVQPDADTLGGQDDGGCGCQGHGTVAPVGSALAFGLLLLFRRRSRRRHRRRR